MAYSELCNYKYWYKLRDKLSAAGCAAADDIMFLKKLSKRVYNILVKNGIYYISELKNLLTRSDNPIRKIWGIGPKRMQEIILALS